MLYTNALQLVITAENLKKSQPNCVKKAPHSLTVHIRSGCRVCFLPNTGTNSSKFYDLRANHLTDSEVSTLTNLLRS